jgi:LacI family transcriptional regulator
MARTEKKPKIIEKTNSKLSQPSIVVAMDWYDERVLRGIFSYAREQSWHMSPYMANGRFTPQGWPGDGAITCCAPGFEDLIKSLKMPIVDISYIDMPKPIPRVLVDNDAICKIAAEHFIHRGYQFFAYYSWEDVPVNTLRRDAYFAHLEALGIPKENIYEIKQSSPALLTKWNSHQKDILSQLAKIPRPLAVFTGQDNLGASLIEMCTRASIHVPEEIAVLGVDNTELLCESSPVPLSSIRTRLEKLGYQAAQQLDRLMKKEVNSKAPPILIQPHGIIKRQSTDVLAVDHPAVFAALRYIKANYHEPITIESIIEYTGLSKRGLEKAFEKHLGRTPANELRRVRLDEAKRLLTETDEKIDFIALSCGYSNSSNLSCAFRRDTQMSPRAYRIQFSQHENE